MSLISVSSLGYDDAIVLQTGAINSVPAGGQAPLQLALNTSQPGSLSVSYILEFASDSLPANPHKFMAVNGYATTLRHGDYDSDGDVDNTDYALWRSTVGSANTATDGNKNGIVDSADYVMWRNNYTGPLGSGSTVQLDSSAPVPEPASAPMLALSLLLTGSLTRRNLRLNSREF